MLDYHEDTCWQVTCIRAQNTYNILGLFFGISIMVRVSQEARASAGS